MLDAITFNQVSGVPATNIDTLETETPACGVPATFAVQPDPINIGIDGGPGTDCTALTTQIYAAAGITPFSGGPQVIALSAATPLFADDFNRADSATLGANYGAIAGVLRHAINANTCNHQNAGGNCADNRTAEAAPDNQWAQATLLIAPGVTDQALIMLRSDAATGNAYGFGYDSVNFGNARARIVKITGGAITNIAASPSVDLAAGDVILCAAFGTALAIIVNGILTMTATDATYASGQWGLRDLLAGTPDVWDNFSGG